MQPNFTMIYEAALAVMHELNWIFHGDDVIPARLVRVVDNGGESCGFAASRRPSHENEALMQCRKFLDDWRKPKLIDGQDFRRDLPEDRCDAVFLIKKIRAVSCFTRDFITEIDIPGLFENLDFKFRRNLIEHRLQFVIL